MAAAKIALQRMVQQRLTQTPAATPAEVVSWLGAVQAQDYMGAKWALGMRMQQANDAMIERAFNEGAILRTHVMRPTWHFVAPADIRWILELTAPGVNAVNTYMYRQLELDDALRRRSNAVLTRALRGGQQLTRAELGVALTEAGIAAEGQRLGYIVHQAELDAVVCSGPRRGKQFTYMLLDERAPQAVSLPREEALAELTRRYFTSHGPATVHDFAWWSGLTKAEVKAGLELVGRQLAHEIIDDESFWFSPSIPPAVDSSEMAFLLPTYDELVIGYTDRSALFDVSQGKPVGSRGNIVFDSLILLGGQVVGSWRRTFRGRAVVIEFGPFKPFTPAEEGFFTAAARRYGEFLDMPVTFA